MLRAYAPLFTQARTRTLVAASLLGRLAIGMFDLPLIVMVADVTGSYATAGAAIGAHAAGIAVAAPLRGRLLDRRGPRGAMPPLVVLSGITLTALPLAASAGEGVLLVAIAGLAGLVPPSFAAAMRLEWQTLLGRDDPRLEQAYAFEASAQISIFVVGGLLAAAGIATIGARGTLLVCAALTVAGGAAFAVLATTPAAPVPRHERRAPIRLPGVLTLVLVTAFADVGLGTIDVAVTAFAIERDADWAAGVLLAIFAASSALGAAASGARAWRAGPTTRLTVVLVALALAIAALALAGSLPVLALLLLLAGPPSAVQWATVSVALDRVAPRGAAAEAYNWLSTANAAGFAVGGLVAGVLVESGGTEAAFLAAAASVLGASAILLTRRRTLAPPGARV